MRAAHPNVLTLLLVLVLAAGVSPSSEAQTPLQQLSVEPPATVASADAYPGRVAVRSVVEGYVVSVEGAWGSVGLYVDAQRAVERVAEEDPRGSVLVREGEVVVTLPAVGRALRLTIPAAGSTEAAAALSPVEAARFHARHGTAQLLESQGVSIVAYSPAPEGLGATKLLSIEDFETVAAAIFRPPVELSGLEVLPAPAFDQTPPDDGGSGCSSSCSVTCPPTNNSCSASTGGTSCCRCRCSQGSASCSCS